MQRFVDALARQPNQVAQLLLRDAQQFADAGVIRVEYGGVRVLDLDRLRSYRAV